MPCSSNNFPMERDLLVSLSGVKPSGTFLPLHYLLSMVIRCSTGIQSENVLLGNSIIVQIPQTALHKFRWQSPQHTQATNLHSAYCTVGNGNTWQVLVCLNIIKHTKGTVKIRCKRLKTVCPHTALATHGACRTGAALGTGVHNVHICEWDSDQSKVAKADPPRLTTVQSGDKWGFSVKAQTVNTSGFVGHAVSVTPT